MILAIMAIVVAVVFQIYVIGLLGKQKKYGYDYPMPALTADVVMFYKNGSEPMEVLLIKRKHDPYAGCWALPGGFMNIDETNHNAAVRELKEETDIMPHSLEPIGLFDAIDRDPRGRIITFAYWATTDSKQVKAGDDAGEARWFKMTDLPKLGFDHEIILSRAMTDYLEYYNSMSHLASM